MSLVARSSKFVAWKVGALMLMKPVSRATAFVFSASICACVSVESTSCDMFR